MEKNDVQTQDNLKERIAGFLAKVPDDLKAEATTLLLDTLNTGSRIATREKALEDLMRVSSGDYRAQKNIENDQKDTQTGLGQLLELLGKK